MSAASFCIAVHLPEEYGPFSIPFSVPHFNGSKEGRIKAREKSGCYLDLVMGHTAKAGTVPMTVESPTEGLRSPGWLLSF